MLLFQYTHRQLVEIAYSWVLKTCGCGVAFKEFHTAACNGEQPDVIGFSSGRSTIVEVKVSRSDFLADKRKHFRHTPQLGMGDHRYYCCPEGMIMPDELPTGWGLVYVSATGKAYCKVRPWALLQNESGNQYKGLYIHPKNLQAEHNLMYSALRRLHLRGRINEIYQQPDVKNENSNTQKDESNTLFS